MSETSQTQTRNLQRRKLSQCVDNATKIITVLNNFSDIYRESHGVISDKALFCRTETEALQVKISKLRSSF